MTGTSGVAFRQAHEAHSEESTAAEAAATSSLTRAEPLRFGGAQASGESSPLQTMRAAAHALPIATAFRSGHRGDARALPQSWPFHCPGSIYAASSSGSPDGNASFR